jgi:hypothetical protein
MKRKPPKNNDPEVIDVQAKVSDSTDIVEELDPESDELIKSSLIFSKSTKSK